MENEINPKHIGLNHNIYSKPDLIFLDWINTFNRHSTECKSESLALELVLVIFIFIFILSFLKKFTHISQLGPTMA